MRTAPQFERDLQRSGVILIKCWLSVSDEEQERRFKARLNDPAKQWKLSKMDLEARRRWVDYAEAKDEMFAYTDTRESPVVRRRSRRQANDAAEPQQPPPQPHPYEEVPHEEIKLPSRQSRAYVRPPHSTQNFVPTRYHVG